MGDQGLAGAGRPGGDPGQPPRRSGLAQVTAGDDGAHQQPGERPVRAWQRREGLVEVGQAHPVVRRGHAQGQSL